MDSVKVLRFLSTTTRIVDELNKRIYVGRACCTCEEQGTVVVSGYDSYSEDLGPNVEYEHGYW